MAMNPLAMQHDGTGRDGGGGGGSPSDSVSVSVKCELVRPVVPPATLRHLNIFATYITPQRSFGHWYTAWYYFMSICFMGYVMFFASFGIVDIIFHFYDYLWILYFTMLVKCAILRRSIFEIRKRLKSQQFSEIMLETEHVLGRARRYFAYAIAANTVVILFYNIVWLVHYFDAVSVVISFMFLLGSTVFTGYMATIILFCLADARYAQKELHALIAKARNGQLTPDLYSETQLKIDFIVKNSFWIDGAMLIFILVNTVSAVVLLLVYDRFLTGYSALEVVSFIIYVLVVMWAVDAGFLMFIIPEIAEVNETFCELHLVLAESKFKDSEAETNRYDTLHLLVARPTRYLIAGFYLTRDTVRHRLAGAFLAMLFFIFRFIIVLILQHH
jgi:hypothetical protein